MTISQCSVLQKMYFMEPLYAYEATSPEEDHLCDQCWKVQDLRLGALSRDCKQVPDKVSSPSASALSSKRCTLWSHFKLMKQLLQRRITDVTIVGKYKISCLDQHLGTVTQHLPLLHHPQ